MIMSRLSSIIADTQLARSRLVDTDNAGLACLELDDETALFRVADHDGEFTAFFAEAYPAGETAVYGPDDLEFSFTGTVQEVLMQVLTALRSRRANRASRRQESDSPSPSPPDLEALDCSPGNNGPCWQQVLEEPPMEPALARDIEAARRSLGTERVVVAECFDSWRVRLHVTLECDGVPLLSERTASAWGLDAAKPMVLEVDVPKKDYLGPEMRSDAVRRVWQDDYPSFLLEKQLLKVFSDFSCISLGRPVPPVSTMPGRNPEEQALLEHYGRKKESLVQKARVGNGFLAQLVLYAQLRMPTLHEFCAICDQPFAIAPMLLRTVCCRDLCMHMLASFGEKITTAQGLNAQAEIVDLLVVMLMRAALSPRCDAILDPYPCVSVGADGISREVFHPARKDFAKLRQVIMSLLRVRRENEAHSGGAWTALAAKMSPEGAGLVQWVMASNRSYLVPLRDDERIRSFETPYQYLLMSASPAVEGHFQELKKKHGSVFAFHGSPAENWHSILRNGLKNASHTRLMTSGAKFGAGVYLSLDSTYSLKFSSRGDAVTAASARQLDATQHALAQSLDGDSLGKLCRSSVPQEQHKPGNRCVQPLESLLMLALCEVIDHPSLRKHDDAVPPIWVSPQEEFVMTRFFLVFTNTAKSSKAVRMNPKLTDSVRTCMAQLRVGQLAPVPAAGPLVGAVGATKSTLAAEACTKSRPRSRSPAGRGPQ